MVKIVKTYFDLLWYRKLKLPGNNIERPALMTKIEGDVNIPNRGCESILRRTCISFLILLAIILQPAVSQGWPQCSFQCPATPDITITRLWLGDSGGNDLPPCTAGNRQTAYLWASFYNGASQARYAVILLADVVINGTLQQSFYDRGVCSVGSIAKRSTTSSPIYSFAWNCGDEIKLTRMVLSWETSSATCGNAHRDCSKRSSKCYGGSSATLIATIPLSSNFTLNTPVCITNNLNLIDKTVGGNAPYSYNWNFGDKSSSTLQNPTHEYAAVGNYTVTLRVTDQSGNAAMTSNVARVLPLPPATITMVI